MTTKPNGHPIKTAPMPGKKKTKKPADDKPLTATDEKIIQAFIENGLNRSAAYRIG